MRMFGRRKQLGDVKDEKSEKHQKSIISTTIGPETKGGKKTFLNSIRKNQFRKRARWEAV